MSTSQDRHVVVGRIVGIYGVRGWVRVESYTAPLENLLGYRRWQLRRGGGWEPVELQDGQPHGKGLIAKLKGLDDREQARGYIGTDIAVLRSELPPLEEGEFYWTDLEGLRVETVSGKPLGLVDYLFATGANDVMVVKDGKRERLIPFVRERVVTRVDLDAGVVVVDWDPEF